MTCIGGVRQYPGFFGSCTNPGQLSLSVHSFDPRSKSWGPLLARATVEVEKVDKERWIRFDLPPMPLHQDEMYGFRIHANNTGSPLVKQQRAIKIRLTEKNGTAIRLIKPGVIIAILAWHIKLKCAADLMSSS